jgi:hypothetical protein
MTFMTFAVVKHDNYVHVALHAKLLQYKRCATRLKVSELYYYYYLIFFYMNFFFSNLVVYSPFIMYIMILLFAILATNIYLIIRKVTQSLISIALHVSASFPPALFTCFYWQKFPCR